MHSIDWYQEQIIQQKAILDGLRPLSDAALRNLRERFRIGFIHHTNAIEGNTLSLQEVKLVVEEGITVGGKTIRELQETINHGEVMALVGDCFDGKFVMNQESVCGLHRVLLEGLVSDEQLGTWRSIPIRVSGSDDAFPGPDEVGGLMDVFFERYSSITSLDMVAGVHYDLVKIHPWVDGNGRMARVLMNLALVSLGYLPMIIPRVLRQEYITSLQGDDATSWRHFFYRQVHENMKDYIRFLKK